MQVFVPYPDIKKSVQCLDPKRLGNQIYRECLTIVRGGWKHHPVPKMWKNHTHFLCEYALAGLEELSYRGKHYPDHYDKFHEIKMRVKDTGPPIWWGDMRVHTSHQANLYHKDPSYYEQFFGKMPHIPYYYPTLSPREVALHGAKYMKEKEQLTSNSY